jgi:hypothetical protein
MICNDGTRSVTLIGLWIDVENSERPLSDIRNNLIMMENVCDAYLTRKRCTKRTTPIETERRRLLGQTMRPCKGLTAFSVLCNTCNIDCVLSRAHLWVCLEQMNTYVPLQGRKLSENAFRNTGIIILQGFTRLWLRHSLREQRNCWEAEFQKQIHRRKATN